ncbi:DUF3634 family protein [Parashewanella curva]|uniref:DUF3634 family protein n=1 Tax=Parashewanella curva TaxID=2338552 RepID=A0A3L8Q1Z5_9GAMM|nr:DUF3634 family protein [Parashewanella curva]RLV61661.1 DUF3634 family protein [Parashewanella curva]
MDNFLKVVFIAVPAVFLIYFLFSNRQGLTLFEMHFKQGKLDRHKGKIPPKFERGARDLAKKNKLTGLVRAEKRNGVRLHISATISDNHSQQLRNIFPFELYDEKTVDNSKLRG